MLNFILKWFNKSNYPKENKSDIRNEKELLNKCFGNKNMVERLIRYELQKNYRLNREQAAKKAIQSIIQDNR